MKYRIIPLHLGTITRNKNKMIYKCESDELVDFPLIAFLLMGNDGSKYLVDTGGGEPCRECWMPYTRSHEQELDYQLLKHGVRPDEIQAVLFTHLHWDHAGNLSLLSNSRFIVQRTEYESVSGRDDSKVEKDSVLSHRFELLDGDKNDVLPGISVILTPGHSPGSQTVIADTYDGPVVMAGDLIPTFENMDLKLPNAEFCDLVLITESIARVMSLGIPVLPGHDMKLLEE